MSSNVYNIFYFFILLFDFIYQWGSIKDYRRGLRCHKTYFDEMKNKKP